MLMWEVIRLPDYELYGSEQLLEAWALDPLYLMIAEEEED